MLIRVGAVAAVGRLATAGCNLRVRYQGVGVNRRVVLLAETSELCYHNRRSGRGQSATNAGGLPAQCLVVLGKEDQLCSE